MNSIQSMSYRRWVVCCDWKMVIRYTKTRNKCSVKYQSQNPGISDDTWFLCAANRSHFVDSLFENFFSRSPMFQSHSLSLIQSKYQSTYQLAYNIQPHRFVLPLDKRTTTWHSKICTRNKPKLTKERYILKWEKKKSDENVVELCCAVIFSSPSGLEFR